MEPQNKLQMEIIKDGRVLKYVETNPSRFGKAGQFTDTYKDEDGNRHYIERIANTIKFTTHSRNTGDGNMISFVTNFKLLLQGLYENCDDKELDRLINKCEYSLSRAKQFYQKENAEEYEERYAKALENKVEEVITEDTFKEPSPSAELALTRLLSLERIQQHPAFNSAIEKQLNNLIELSNEPDLKM